MNTKYLPLVILFGILLLTYAVIRGSNVSVNVTSGSGSGTAATTVTTETLLDIASTVGTSTAYARSDHTHGSPTSESVNDAVGGILTDTASVDMTYDDAGNQIRADVLPAGVDHNSLNNLAVGDAHTQYQKESEKSIAGGYAGIEATGYITTSWLGTFPSGQATNYFLNSLGEFATVTATGGGSGDVVGPASSIDNEVVRFDGATGKLIQGSGMIVADGGAITSSVWNASTVSTAYLSSNPIYASNAFLDGLGHFNYMIPTPYYDRSLTWFFPASVAIGDWGAWLPIDRAGEAGGFLNVYAVWASAATAVSTIRIQASPQTLIDGTPSWSNVLSTDLTIDANERSSNTATTPAVFGSTTWSANDHFRVNFISGGNFGYDLTVKMRIRQKVTSN